MKNVFLIISLFLTVGLLSQTTELAQDVPSYDITKGDVNGDGYLDLITTGPSKISVFYNNGGTEFTLNQELILPHNPYPVKLGDFDNDGDLDLVVATLVSGYDTNGIWHNSKLAWFENIDGMFGSPNVLIEMLDNIYKIESTGS